jgi:hypothetical protein
LATIDSPGQEVTMPDPFNKAKMSGDTHPPEVESDLPFEEANTHEPGVPGAPRDRGLAGDTGEEDRPSRGVKKAGLPKDRGAQTGNGDGKTRDSGEASGPSQR